MNQKELEQFYDLVTFSIEGTANPEQFSMLKQTLRRDPDAVKCYVDYISMLSFFRSSEILKDAYDVPECLDNRLWNQLAVYEKAAPAIELTKEEPQRELIQKVVYPPREKRKLSKFNLYSAIVGVAAMLAVGLFVKLTPVATPYHAVIFDSLNARWADASKPVAIGSELSQDDGDRWLLGGYIKLLFGTGVEVVIESPARFKILSGHELTILSGRAYSTVLEKGRGFTVYTPNAKVVDLGTEFGVEVFGGDSSVHMIKGKAAVLANTDLPAQKPLALAAGFAKKIGRHGITQDIKLDDDIFVTDVSSGIGTIYRADKAFKVGLWETQLAPVLENNLRTDGRLIQAVNLGPTSTTPATVSGILFEPLTHDGIISGGNTGQVTGVVFYDGPNNALTSLLTTGRELSFSSNRIAIEMDGLKIGQAYRIQLILGFYAPWCDVNLYGVNSEYEYFADTIDQPALGLAAYRWEAASSNESVSLYLRAYSDDKPWNKVCVFGYVLHEINDSIDVVKN